MYPDLYRIIGVTYGPGNGSTTFNLPNLLNKFVEGSSTAGLVKEAGLPNIKGSFLSPDTQDTSKRVVSGSFYHSSLYSTASIGGTSSGYNHFKTQFAANVSSSVYKNDCDTVQPPAVTVRYIIKAFNGATQSSSLVDMTQYANDLANRLTREMTPAFNKRVEIRTSGTFTAPVTGWYKFTIKGGGGGGASGTLQSTSATYYYGGGGGGEGGTTFAYEKMNAGETATITIGAGGTGGTGNDTIGGDGGNTSVIVNSITYIGGSGSGGKNHTNGGGGGNGGSGTIIGAPGVAGDCCVGAGSSGGTGGGNGGGASTRSSVPLVNNGSNGGGGAGGIPYNPGPGGAGGDGYVFIEYFDPTL